jgi:hypothetical protein
MQGTTRAVQCVDAAMLPGRGVWWEISTVAVRV